MEFSLLPLPENFIEVLDEHERLPLEFISEDWLLIVCCDAQNHEYAPIVGRALHRQWERSQFQQFSTSSTGVPGDAIPVVLPNGRLLAVKILSYEAKPKSKNSQPVERATRQAEQPTESRSRIKLNLRPKKA